MDPRTQATGGTLPALVAAVVLAAGIAAAYGTAGGRPTSLDEFPLDDAWIHQVYVRSLLAGGVPTYNPGVPEAGFTSPLWLAVLLPFHAAGDALGAGPVEGAKLASLLMAVLAALGVARVTRALGAGPAVGVVAVVVLLSGPGFGFAAASGMEVTLATACAAFATAFLLEERWRAAGVLLALAALARPEEALLLVPALAWAARGADGRARRLAAILLPSAMAGLGWVAWDLYATGRPLPTTFYAKAGSGTLPEHLEQFVRLVLGGQGWGREALLATAWAAGLVAVAKGRGGRARALLVAAVHLLPLAAVLAVHPFRGEARFYAARYAYPFLALGAVLSGPGLAALAGAAIGASRRALPGAAVAAAAVPAAVILAAAVSVPGIRSSIASYAGHCAEVRAIHVLPALAARDATAPGEWVAAEAAGAARYLSDRPVVDLVGLNDHALLAAAGDDLARTCLIAGRAPAVFLVPPAWLDLLSPAFDLVVRGEWEAPLWTGGDGTKVRTLVAAAARVRPEVLETCRKRYGRGG